MNDGKMMDTVQGVMKTNASVIEKQIEAVGKIMEKGIEATTIQQGESAMLPLYERGVVSSTIGSSADVAQAGVSFTGGGLGVSASAATSSGSMSAGTVFVMERAGYIVTNGQTGVTVGEHVQAHTLPKLK